MVKSGLEFLQNWGPGRQVAKRDFVEHHIVEAFRGGLAEANGDENLARRLRAQAKLRLICMSDEELWELAKLNSSPPERPVEPVYKAFKQTIEEHKVTANDWASDLAKRPTRVKETKDDK